jgi:hypothetical protein
MQRLFLHLRQTLPWLVLALPLLILTYAVVMVAATLLAALGDALGALVLRWMGIVLALGFGMCSISLLFLLGVERITEMQTSARN